MPRLALNDGYTLPFATESCVADPASGRIVADDLPVVTGRYRPALPDALAEWRYALTRATSGKAEVDATARFIADHLCDWDVMDHTGKPAPPTPENVRRVPEPILDQILRTITHWAGPTQEQSAGN